MISRPRWVSRLPVGSSASSTVGLRDQRARDRHALLLAAGQLGRRVALPPGQARPRPAPRAPPRAAPRRVSPRYSSGSSTFSCALVRGSRLKPWNTKPRCARRSSARWSRSSRCTAHAAEQVLAGAGRVQAADDVHRRRLARAAGPHDGDELAGLDVQVHAAQRLHLGLALAVDAGDAAQADQRGRRRAAVPARSLRAARGLPDDHRHAGLQLLARHLGHAAVADARRHRHGARLAVLAAPRPGAPARCRCRRGARRRCAAGAASCSTRCCCRPRRGRGRGGRRREAQRRVGHQQHVAALDGGDGGRGRHARAQRQVVVVDAAARRCR